MKESQMLIEYRLTRWVGSTEWTFDVTATTVYLSQLKSKDPIPFFFKSFSFDRGQVLILSARIVQVA